MLKQVFIDSIPGPTNHFGGHAIGNIASIKSKNNQLNPRKAALEWLEKANKVFRIGGHQLILPPQRRPLGFKKKSFTHSDISSSFIWMANAGLFIPSIDSQLKEHQFIPANMKQSKHRKIEYPFHQHWIKKVLLNSKCNFHNILNENDEGSANTIRLWHKNHEGGVNVFVYGTSSDKFSIRQSKISCQKMIESTKPKHWMMLEQTKEAIDAGVFHNDVISFGFKNTIICHEKAFLNQKKELFKLKNLYENSLKTPLNIIEISNKELSLDTAVATYLFNSQVIEINNKFELLCPIQVKHHRNSVAITEEWLSNGLFNKIHFVNVESSLKNGGGPACLRFCLYLTNNEINEIPNAFKLNKLKYQKIRKIINEDYPTAFNFKEVQKNPNHFRKIVKKLEQLF